MFYNTTYTKECCLTKVLWCTRPFCFKIVCLFLSTKRPILPLYLARLLNNQFLVQIDFNDTITILLMTTYNDFTYNDNTSNDYL